MIRILVVDDHPAIGQGTKMMIEKDSSMKVDVITDEMGLVEKINRNELNYDVYIFDLYMPNINGLELTKIINRAMDDVKVLIYTGFDINNHYSLAIESGALGIISKSSSIEQLTGAIKAVHAGFAVIPISLFKSIGLANNDSKPLNEKELCILVEVEKGLTNREISEVLHMSQRNIEYILTTIFQKLKVKSRVEALKKSKELGLLSDIVMS